MNVVDSITFHFLAHSSNSQRGMGFLFISPKVNLLTTLTSGTTSYYGDGIKHGGTFYRLEISIKIKVSGKF